MNNPKYYYMASLDHDGTLHLIAGNKGDVEHEYNLAKSIRGPRKLFISYQEYTPDQAIPAIMTQSGAKEYTLRYIGEQGDLPL